MIFHTFREKYRVIFVNPLTSNMIMKNTGVIHEDVQYPNDCKNLKFNLN